MGTLAVCIGRNALRFAEVLHVCCEWLQGGSRALQPLELADGDHGDASLSAVVGDGAQLRGTSTEVTCMREQHQRSVSMWPAGVSQARSSRRHRAADWRD